MIWSARLTEAASSKDGILPAEQRGNRPGEEKVRESKQESSEKQDGSGR